MNNTWILIFLSALAILTIAFLLLIVSKKKKLVVAPKFEVRRLQGNPILSPKKDEWQSEATFNPTVIADKKGDVHMLYRAMGKDGISRIGYAKSKDGIHFTETVPYPVFALENPRQIETTVGTRGYDRTRNPSGGGWSGAEDPRMVSIDGRIYVTFNAFDGWDFVRVGLVSINEPDFFDQKFKWSKPIFLSPKGEVNKNWVIFPEKINGKFAILHSINSGIQIDYVSSFDEIAHGSKVIKSSYGQKAPRDAWDTWVRSAGPTPIKTRLGWLVLYHAINKKEPDRYKLGALLLDLKDPKKLIARAPWPLLMPDMWYENDWKPGIIYACGALVRKDSLYIYYGGGDRYVCAAHTPLEPFLTWLITYGKVV